MIDFDEYSKKIQKSTNFAKLDNFDRNWFIIESTFVKDEHKMLMGEVYQTLQEVYDDLEEFEIADLTDRLELEKIWTIT